MNEEPQAPQYTEENPEPMQFPADNTFAPSQPISLEWSAPEFISHQKDRKWYLILGGTAFFIAVVIWLLTRDTVAAILVLVGALVLGVYAGREPRELPYSVNATGVTIGNKYHGYDEYRSFGVVPENELSSVILMPLKRFAQTLTIYFPHEKEDEVVAVLLDRLPYEEHKHDPIDSLMRIIRF